MPPIIENNMFADCGMNCMVCYKHYNVKKHRKACAGCFGRDLEKTKHCRTCKIKDCLKEKDLTYCYECYDFPWKLIKNLEKSDNLRYKASLIQNSLFVKEQGVDAFAKAQKNSILASSAKALDRCMTENAVSATHL